MGNGVGGSEAAKTPRPKEKIDPQLVAKARELLDRYLEHANATGGIEDAAQGRAKYDVSRALGSSEPNRKAAPLLTAAA